MFNCSSCSEEEIESGMSSECSACRSSECLECLDENAICVPCSLHFNL
jgi:hypothetical protein